MRVSAAWQGSFRGERRRPVQYGSICTCFCVRKSGQDARTTCGAGIRNGRLTEARRRFEAGTARPNKWTFESSSCWSVVCEEVIDTDHDPEGYDAVYAELIRRGFSADEIDDMRKLAWRTAGWLNYDMMVWDWCNLDESDMQRALDLKLERRLTRKKTYDRDLKMIREFLDRDPPTAKKTTAERVVDGKPPEAPQRHH